MLRVTPPHTRRYKLSSHPRARTLRTKHGRRFPRAASPMDAHLDVPAPHAPAPSHVHRRLAARIHDPPAVRNVGEAVPEHGAELDDDADDDERRRVRRCEAEDDGGDDGDKVDERGDPPGRVRHPLKLCLRPHQEARRADRDRVAKRVLDRKRGRVARDHLGEGHHRRERDDDADDEAYAEAVQTLLEGKRGAHTIDDLLAHSRLKPDGRTRLIVERRLRARHRSGALIVVIAAEEAAEHRACK
mmetsp:Transcript_5782/g.15006  ORF Transcript_5782/g.15006 Transcript_5782/m.15006 type:complete len:244 (-) Transcript_5782:114-845(-)